MIRLKILGWEIILGGPNVITRVLIKGRIEAGGSESKEEMTEAEVNEERDLKLLHFWL